MNLSKNTQITLISFSAIFVLIGGAYRVSHTKRNPISLPIVPVVQQSGVVGKSGSIPLDCVRYFDGCNTCMVRSGHLGGCTRMFCEHQEEPTCLLFQKTGSSEPTACTMEYRPVCAKVDVQCIKAPCPSIEQTFGNACSMRANKLALFLHDGECSLK